MAAYRLAESAVLAAAALFALAGPGAADPPPQDAPPASKTVEGLTRYDVAYLKGLYSIDPQEYAAAQRSEIGSRILREMAAP